MLTVRVVGRLALMLDGQALRPPRGRPARALLGWLATHPGRHPRGPLAAELWPDFRDESARANLRTALSAVREALGSAAATTLLADRQVVGLADSPVVAVDVREFDALLEAGRAVEAIAALGEGELLPDLDFDWVFRERDRLRERLSGAMATVAAATEAAGDRTGAIDWLRRRTEGDPFDEPAHRDLIEALDRAGDRAGAVVVYERLTERLRRELGVAPSAATRGLAASVRAQPAAPAGAGYTPEAQRRGLPPRLDPGRWRGEFVGRADALARLHAAWAGVQGGGIALVIVVGEAGSARPDSQHASQPRSTRVEGPCWRASLRRTATGRMARSSTRWKASWGRTARLWRRMRSMTRTRASACRLALPPPSNARQGADRCCSCWTISIGPIPTHSPSCAISGSGAWPCPRSR